MTLHRPQEMLREFLSSLGFAAMARDVVTETDPARLRHYARIVLRQVPQRQKVDVKSLFAKLGLM